MSLSAFSVLSSTTDSPELVHTEQIEPPSPVLKEPARRPSVSSTKSNHRLSQQPNIKSIFSLLEKKCRRTTSGDDFSSIHSRESTNSSSDASSGSLSIFSIKFRSRTSATSRTHSIASSHSVTSRESRVSQFVSGMFCSFQATARNSALPPQISKNEPKGPIFNTTIAEAALVAGKNGIPDIVIQCVEYLESMQFLETEGRYRIPGSIKRVKYWCEKFQEPYMVAILPKKPTIGKQPLFQENMRRIPFAAAAAAATAIITTVEASGFLNVQQQPLNSSHSKSSVIAACGSAKTIEKCDGRDNCEQNRVFPVFSDGQQKSGLWGGDILSDTSGFPVKMDNETAATVASVLKKFLAYVEGKFIPDGFWEELNELIRDSFSLPPNGQLLLDIREYIEFYLPTRHHLHTFAYVMMHLQRVSRASEQNKMTPKNIVLCVLVGGLEGAEYIVRHADLIFECVDLVGRDVVASLPRSTGDDAQINKESFETIEETQSESSTTQFDLMRKWFRSVSAPVSLPRKTTAESRKESLENPIIITSPMFSEYSLSVANAESLKTHRSSPLSSPSQEAKVNF